MCFYFVYGLKPFIIKKFFNDKSDRAKSGYNTENVISNCNNFSLIINVICDCCDGLVGSPILAVFLLYASFNLSSWFQYFTELMISFWKRLLSIMIEYIFPIPNGQKNFLQEIHFIVFATIEDLLSLNQVRFQYIYTYNTLI